LAKSGDSEIALLRARVAELEAKLTEPAPTVAPVDVLDVKLVEPAPLVDLPASAERRLSPAEVRAAAAAAAKAKKRTKKPKPAPKPKAAPKPAASERKTEAAAAKDDDPPIDARQSMMVAGIALVVLVAGIGGVLLYKGSPGRQADEAALGGDAQSATWVYRAIAADNGDITRTACLRSTGLVAQAPPIEPVRAELCLLDSDTQGKDAYIALLGPGRLPCDGDCRLTAKFGAERSQVIAGRSVPGSEHMVFVRDLPEFEPSLRDAESTELTVGVGAPDVQKITFNTFGLDWETGLARAAETAAGPEGNARRDAVWLRRPTNQEVRAVYPAAARRDGRGGQATLSCEAGQGGALTACTVTAERPRGYGFGRAALQLAGKFRVRPSDSGRVSAVVSFAANNLNQRTARSNGQIYLAPIGAGQDFGRQRIPEGSGAQAVTLGQQDDTVRLPGGQGQVVEGENNPAASPSQASEQPRDIDLVPGV